jgi:hypothetical protein
MLPLDAIEVIVDEVHYAHEAATECIQRILNGADPEEQVTEFRYQETEAAVWYANLAGNSSALLVQAARIARQEALGINTDWVHELPCLEQQPS